MNDLYPPGTTELPGEKEELKTYVFTIVGEVEVEGYSEEDAEEYFKDNISEIIHAAINKGHLSID